MAQISAVKTAGHGATVVALLFSIGSIARAAPVQTVTTRNPHNFVLQFKDLKFIGGGWTGDAKFTISACPQQSCFHLSGPIKIVSSPKSEVTDHEGFFAIPGSACILHFEEVSRQGMDSFDYRLTLVGKDQGGRNCRSIPAGLNGVYRQAN